MDKPLDLLQAAMSRAAPASVDSRIAYFPVRHHSPACAWHVRRFILDRRPDAVLIEGPRDATPLIPLLLHGATKPPIAIYTTYVQRPKDDSPRRHAAYYPLCEYSPEYQALRGAAEVGARSRFIDLTWPEKVEATKQEPDDKLRSLQDERLLRQSRRLAEMCRHLGARDSDDLWDQMFEVGHRALKTDKFIRHVLAYCALARMDASDHVLQAEGELAREHAMAHAVAEESGRLVVVTGGFHSVALPKTEPVAPAAVKVKPEDALVVLMRYGFEQLDRLNGYASGMPSPEFYQRGWDGKDTAEVLVEIARELRPRGGGSTADAIAALEQVRRMAILRNHVDLSREDVLDSVRSCFIKGVDEIEGVLVMAEARRLLAGRRIGDLPPEAGQPPIVSDFRESATRLGLSVDSIDAREVSLDLYRNARHRELSRFFRRLQFLGLDFAKCIRGPDFVAGEGLHLVQEVWRYHWAPWHEATLIERALYGSSLEDAAAAMLLEQLTEADRRGQGRSAGLAATLLLEACRMGLHRQTPGLLAKTAAFATEDPSFPSVVSALENVLVLSRSREPLEAHHLQGIDTLATSLYRRACYLLAFLGSTADEELEQAFEAMNALPQAAQSLGDSTELRELRRNGLRVIAAAACRNAPIQGAAQGLLFGDGQVDAMVLGREIAGHLQSDREQGTAGARFLRGLLRVCRSALWQSPEVVAEVHRALAEWDEKTFLRQLPHLRLALADLTPRECDRAAQAVAAHAGVAHLAVHRDHEFEERDLLAAVALEQHIVEALARDGLAAWGKTDGR